MNKIKQFIADHDVEIVAGLVASCAVAVVLVAYKKSPSFPNGLYTTSDNDLVKNFEHPIVVDKPNFDMLTEFWFENH